MTEQLYLVKVWQDLECDETQTALCSRAQFWNEHFHKRLMWANTGIGNFGIGAITKSNIATACLHNPASYLIIQCFSF